METAKPAKPSYRGSKNQKKPRRRNSAGSLDGQRVRSISEGSRRKTRPRNVSRDSSTGSSALSLDVRCACQYFQGDTLTPEKARVNFGNVVIRLWYVNNVSWAFLKSVRSVFILLRQLWPAPLLIGFREQASWHQFHFRCLQTVFVHQNLFYILTVFLGAICIMR